MSWTQEWPKEPGTYWFFDPDVYKQRILLATVAKNNNGVHIMSEARFLYREESPNAYFMPVTLPEVPTNTSHDATV